MRLELLSQVIVFVGIGDEDFYRLFPGYRFEHVISPAVILRELICPLVSVQPTGILPNSVYHVHKGYSHRGGLWLICGLDLLVVAISVGFISRTRRCLGTWRLSLVRAWT